MFVEPSKDPMEKKVLLVVCVDLGYYPSNLNVHFLKIFFLFNNVRNIKLNLLRNLSMFGETMLEQVVRIFW